MADKTPNDGAFRRSLFVLLVVIGTLAAAAFIYSRDAQADAQREIQRANADRDQAQRERDELQTSLDELLAQQRLILERNRVEYIVQRREADASAERMRRLERLVASLLAASTDPAVAGAIREQGVKPQSSKPAPPRRGQQARPSSPPTLPNGRPAPPRRPTSPGKSGAKPARFVLEVEAAPCTSVICLAP